MAFSTFHISYNVRDYIGNNHRVVLHFDKADIASLTIAEVQTLADEYGAIIEDMQTGKITEYSLGYRLTNALSQNADASSRVATGATFSFIDSNEVPITLYIPAVKDDIFDTQGNIDLTDTAVAAFIGAVTAGTGITGTVKVSQRATGAQANALRYAEYNDVDAS